MSSRPTFFSTHNHLPLGKMHNKHVDTCNRKISFQTHRLRKKVSSITYSSWWQKNNRGLFINIPASCKEWEIINCTVGCTCLQCRDKDKTFWHLTNSHAVLNFFFINSQDKQHKNNASKCKKIQSNTKWHSNPSTGLDRPWGFQEVEAPRFQDSRHMKVVGLSLLHTGHLYSQEMLWYSFLLEADLTPGPRWGQKDYVNEKFQWYHWESNPQPPSL